MYRTTVGLPGSAPRRASFDPGGWRRTSTTVDIVHVHGVRPGQPTAEEVAAPPTPSAPPGTPLVVTGYHLSDPRAPTTPPTPSSSTPWCPAPTPS